MLLHTSDTSCIHYFKAVRLVACYIILAANSEIFGAGTRALYRWFLDKVGTLVRILCTIISRIPGIRVSRKRLSLHVASINAARATERAMAHNLGTWIMLLDSGLSCLNCFRSTWCTRELISGFERDKGELWSRETKGDVLLDRKLISDIAVTTSWNTGACIVYTVCLK